MLARTPSFEWERPSGAAPGAASGGLALVMIVPAALVVGLLCACLLSPATAPGPAVDSLASTIGGP